MKTPMIFRAIADALALRLAPKPGASTIKAKAFALPDRRAEGMKVIKCTLVVINVVGCVGFVFNLGWLCDLICFYANVMGWTMEQARAAVERHNRHLSECGQPFGR